MNKRKNIKTQLITKIVILVGQIILEMFFTKLITD